MYKKVGLRLLTICMFYLFMVGMAIAGTTYYVSPAGNDSNNGSINAPFRTIQKAADIVNPGDTVIVKDGVYTVASNVPDLVVIKRGGIAGSPVTFKAENKWKAVLDGLNEDHNGIHVNAPYVIIEGFEIKNIYWQGIIVEASNVIIRNNYIHNVGNWHIKTDYPYCSQYGVPEPGCNPLATNGIIPGGDNIVIENNIIHTIGKTGWTGKYEPGRYDHAIYGTYVNNLKIINNVIWDVWTGKALDLAASNSIVANNTILRLTEPPSGQPTDSGLMAITGGSNQVIQNNIFYGCNGRPPIKTYNSLSYSLSVNNNLTSPDCPLLSSMGNITGVTFSNNIENVDPLFIDLSGRDFHLKSSSPAIDKGKSFSDRSKDADGNPIIGLPDIGAYEYVGPTAVTPTKDTTPPSAPTNLTARADSSSTIFLSWNASTDNVRVAGYRIYRNGSLIATTTSTSYTNSNLSPLTSYTYAVSAYDAAGNESARSNSVTVTTPTSNQVNNITIRAKGSYAGGAWPVMDVWVNGSKINSFTVNSSTYKDYLLSFNSSPVTKVDIVFVNDYYNPSTGEDRNLWVDYIIVNNQKYESESSYAFIDKGYGSAAFDAIDVIPGQEGIYWYAALRFSLSTSQPNDNLSPSTPLNLKATSITSNSISLSWTASTDNVGVKGYKVYRNGVQISTTSSTTFKDTNLLPSTVYTYTITAFDEAGNESLPSDSVSIKTTAKKTRFF